LRNLISGNCKINAFSVQFLLNSDYLAVLFVLLPASAFSVLARREQKAQYAQCQAYLPHPVEHL
jgi:hypothetical protein